MAARTIGDTIVFYDRAVAGFIEKFDGNNGVHPAINATVEKLKSVSPPGELNGAQTAERDRVLLKLLADATAIQEKAKTFIASFSFMDCTDKQAQMIKSEADKTDQFIQTVIAKIKQRKDLPKETCVQEPIDLKPYRIGQQFQTDLAALKTQNVRRADAIDRAFLQIRESAQRKLGDAKADRVTNAELIGVNEQKKTLQYQSLSLNLSLANCKSLNQRQKDFFKRTHNANLIVLDDINETPIYKGKGLNNESALVLRKPLDLDAQNFEANIKALLQSSSPKGFKEARQAAPERAKEALANVEPDHHLDAVDLEIREETRRDLKKAYDDLRELKAAFAESQVEEDDLYMSAAPIRDKTVTDEAEPLIAPNNPGRHSRGCFGF